MVGFITSIIYFFYFIIFRVAKVVAPKKAALKVAEGELAEAMGVKYFEFSFFKKKKKKKKKTVKKLLLYHFPGFIF